MNLISYRITNPRSSRIAYTAMAAVALAVVPLFLLIPILAIFMPEKLNGVLHRVTQTAASLFRKARTTP
jgi:uncharacterized membrane-anchored protein